MTYAAMRPILGAIILLQLVATASVCSPQNSRTVKVYADDYTKLMWYDADLRGFVEQRMPERSGEPWGTQQWTGTGQSATWNVEVSEEGRYEVSILYLCPTGGAGSMVQVSADGNALASSGVLRETGNAWRQPGWELQQLSGLLHLHAGRTKVSMRIAKRGGNSAEILQLRSLELVKPSVRDQMEERARRLRSDASWMIASKYGLMTHWTPFTQPQRGDQKPYCDAVHDFDVPSYVKMVRDTGAGYLVFTTGWGGFWFPAPIPAMNAAMPGRGCDRDLVMELAEELLKHNIKLVLYFGWNVGILDYRQAWGDDLSQWPPKLADFLKEVGERYGKKVSGFFFDGGYESQVYPFRFPYEDITRAAKTGDPDRLVSYNNWIFPKLTSFQDYWIGESSHDLLPPPGARAFEKEGPQEGIQSHLNTFLDDFDWCHTKPNSDMLPPWHTSQQVVDYVQRAVSEKAVATINISIYQDGTVQEATLKQMEAVRLAVRGR